MSDTDTPYWTVITPDGIDAAAAQKAALAALDRLEALATQITDERDDALARISAAAMFARFAIASAEAALDGWGHVPYAPKEEPVYDHVIEALAHLRTVQKVLEGTPPTMEAPSKRRIRRH